MDFPIKPRVAREIPSPVLLELLEQLYEGEDFQSREMAKKRLSCCGTQEVSKLEIAGPSKKKEDVVEGIKFLIDDMKDLIMMEKTESSDKLFHLEKKEVEKRRGFGNKTVKFLLPFNIPTPRKQEKERRSQTPLTPYSITVSKKDVKKGKEVRFEGEKYSSTYSSLGTQTNNISDGTEDERNQTTFDFARKTLHSYIMSHESGDNWNPGKTGQLQSESETQENNFSVTQEKKCCCFQL